MERYSLTDREVLNVRHFRDSLTYREHTTVCIDKCQVDEGIIAKLHVCLLFSSTGYAIRHLRSFSADQSIMNTRQDRGTVEECAAKAWIKVVDKIRVYG